MKFCFQTMFQRHTTSVFMARVKTFVMLYYVNNVIRLHTRKYHIYFYKWQTSNLDKSRNGVYLLKTMMSLLRYCGHKLVTIQYFQI